MPFFLSVGIRYLAQIERFGVDRLGQALDIQYLVTVPNGLAVTRTGVLLSNTNQESSSRYGQERKTQAKDGPQRTGRTRSTQDLFLTSKCLAKAQGLTAQALFTTGCHANLEMDLLHQSKNFLG